MPPGKRDYEFAIDLITETVALVEIPSDDANKKYKKMPTMVTSYQVDQNRLHTNFQII